MDLQDYRALIREIAKEQAKLSTSSFFVTGEESLRLRTFGSVSGVTLALEGRFLTPDGRIHPFAHTHTPASDRTVATSLHALGEGFVLNVSVRASGGTPRIGQVFAIVEIVRGLTGAVQPLACLLEGYVTDTQRLAWPGAPLQASSAGPGVIRSITGTNPAAGAEVTEAVPTNARWRVLMARAILVTSAVVGNRTVRLSIDDGANELARYDGLTNQAASATTRYTFAAIGFAMNANVGGASIPLPPAIVLEDGMRLVTSTSSLDIGDDWGAPQLLVEEWIED